MPIIQLLLRATGPSGQICPLPLALTRLCVDSDDTQTKDLTISVSASSNMPQPTHQIRADYAAGFSLPTAQDRDTEVMAGRFERMGLPRVVFMQQLEQARQAYAGAEASTSASNNGRESGKANT